MSESKIIFRIAKREINENAVWFMRQAGRYLPEYSVLKNKYSFLGMMKDSEVIEGVSTLPLKYFPTDGIVVFTDILLPLTKIGLKVSYENGIEISEEKEEFDYYPPLRKAINRISQGHSNKTIIGITGGPFTVLSYALDKGEKGYPKTKLSLLDGKPTDRLIEELVSFAKLQVDAGCDIIQVFESWVGNVSLNFYRKFLGELEEEFIRRVKELGKPVIFFSEGSTHLFGEFSKTEIDVFSIDWRTGFQAFKEKCQNCVVQGNLDPYLLSADDAFLRGEIRRIMSEGRKMEGHIFNLGHGVPPWADPGKLNFIVDEVKKFE
ncbi:MAG: hypothetical protein M1526_02055 [Candidatus Thermoplasmatota archaeon]|jgi:uroporphyrinogen decarboxylase|nr:hypothetical protein [Candidatus Thermoplasmatota archaeon]